VDLSAWGVQVEEAAKKLRGYLLDGREPHVPAEHPQALQVDVQFLEGARGETEGLVDGEAAVDEGREVEGMAHGIFAVVG